MNTYMPALIGLLGVLLGGFISFLTNYFSKKKEAQLRILEKIFDKRIKAHEDILLIVQMLRTTYSSHEIDSEGNGITYSSILHDKESFNEFKNRFHSAANPNIHWISIELYREINYIQDYIESLTIQLNSISSTKYQRVALLIKDDIISLATNLEKETLKFFDKDIYSIQVRSSKGHHKLPKAETIRRFDESELSKVIDNFKVLME